MQLQIEHARDALEQSRRQLGHVLARELEVACGDDQLSSGVHQLRGERQLIRRPLHRPGERQRRPEGAAGVARGGNFFADHLIGGDDAQRALELLELVEAVVEHLREPGGKRVRLGPAPHRAEGENGQLLDGRLRGAGRAGEERAQQRRGRAGDPQSGQEQQPPFAPRRDPARGDGIDRDLEIARRLVAGVRALRETAAHDALDGARDAARKWGRLVVQNRKRGFHPRGPREGALPGEHLEEDGAEGEEIGPVIDLVPAHLLRSHVPDRPDDGAGLGGRRDLTLRQPGGLRHQLGDAEVEDLEHAVLGDEQVLRFYVAVDHSLRVRRRKPVRELARVLDRRLQR